MSLIFYSELFPVANSPPGRKIKIARLSLPRKGDQWAALRGAEERRRERGGSGVCSEPR